MSSSIDKKGSEKVLGLWMSTSLVIGNMIGSGIFLLPASLAFYGGISIFGWLFTTAGAMLVAIVFSRLSRNYPKVGGPYAYTRKGFGDLPGFLVGWSYWISIWAGNAAIATAFIGYLSVFIPALENNIMLSVIFALTAIWLLSLVSSLGVRHAGGVQLITVILKLLPLIVLILFGFLFFNIDHFKPFNLSEESNFSAITATATLTLWAFLGLESATIPAENVKNPKRTIPRATMFGTIITALVYILGTMVVMGVIPPETLKDSNAPFADAAEKMWGEWGRYLVAAGAAISCFGALNGWIMLQGQLPMAIAKDGLFPKLFGNLSKRGTPVFGIIISSVLATLLIVMNYTKSLVEKFTFIILLATLATLVPYVFCSLAELKLLLQKRELYDHRKLIKPLIIVILAFLYSMWAIAGAGIKVILWGMSLFLAGIIIFFWIRKKSKS